MGSANTSQTGPLWLVVVVAGKVRTPHRFNSEVDKHFPKNAKHTHTRIFLLLFRTFNASVSPVFLVEIFRSVVIIVIVRLSTNRWKILIVIVDSSLACPWHTSDEKHEIHRPCGERSARVKKNLAKRGLNAARDRRVRHGLGLAGGGLEPSLWPRTCDTSGVLDVSRLQVWWKTNNIRFPGGFITRLQRLALIMATTGNPTSSFCSFKSIISIIFGTRDQHKSMVVVFVPESWDGIRHPTTACTAQICSCR